ncbi:MAG: hypothetical protein HYS18_15915 [Burkholderiales bacterium]|nr:hypothetical protein [Burkholderiales bacterium]
MNQLEKASQFFVARSTADRRAGDRIEPPYFTEEGIVMVDRRESQDRRLQRASESANKLAYLVPTAAV